LCTYSADRVTQYALVNNKTGNLYVTSDEAAAYENYSSDKYSFAWAMIGMDGFNWEDGFTTTSETGMYIGYPADENADFESSNFKYRDGSALYMTEAEAEVYEKYVDSDDTLKEKYNAILEASTTADKQTALEAFRDYLYADKQGYADDIFNEMNYNKNGTKGVDNDLDYPDTEWSDVKSQFQYYIKRWEAINEAGGCEVLSAEYTSGDTGTEWYKNMSESGLVTTMYYNTGTANKGWTETSATTSIDTNYLQETSDDTDLKKAEAEYQHELSIINKKDTKFDTELSKLETERTSITTEIDSIKQVRDDNIDRTFGIFS
jgi:hypothetical protein